MTYALSNLRKIAATTGMSLEDAIAAINNLAATGATMPPYVAEIEHPATGAKYKTLNPKHEIL